MKVSEIKQVIEGLSDEDEVYCLYEDCDELHFSLETEENLIDMANNMAGEDDFETEGCEPIADIDTAIQYIVEFDDEKHIME